MIGVVNERSLEARALVQIAARRAGAGRKDEAAAALSQAANAEERILNPYGRVMCFMGIVAACVNLEETDKASEVLCQALESAKTVARPEMTPTPCNGSPAAMQ